MTISIRKAQAGDGAALHAMVRELAVNHGHEEHFEAQPEHYENAITRPDAIVAAVIAEWNGVPAGCAIFHRSFSTFRGRETLYLEDVSVLPQYRRKGIARALLRAVAQEAKARGVPSVSWLMMGWNDSARALYEGVGAEIESDNCFCRLHGEALERLAA